MENVVGLTSWFGSFKTSDTEKPFLDKVDHTSPEQSRNQLLRKL